LIEDKMNAPHDILEMGVQAVILVEDSIRYYSSMLPILYKIFFIQSQRSSIEGANSHQQNLRMRGRPKILLATNYNDALALFEKFQENILGVFSDVRYKINNTIDKQAGLKLCKKIQSIDQNVPLLLLSSESNNKALADDMNIDFIGKYNKNFSFELRNFIIKNLHLGSFHFYCPAKKKVICTASSLKSFQELILKISPESLAYHVSKNHITKWLNSRSLFLLARRFKHLTPEHFENIEDIRNFIYEAISNYRLNSGRGVITKFEQNTFDSYSIFSRIGDGYIGGKARGLAFTDLLIKKYKLRKKYDDVTITIPRTAILCTDIFDEFMETNKLYDIGTSNLSDDEILHHFINAKLPNRIFTSLYSFISYTDNPIAIRSSSRLEDSHYQPFAGVYSTYMIPNVVDDKHLTIKLLTEAIKSVYASVFYKDSKAYMAATANVIDEEKMGVVLQDVCGTSYNDRFYPSFSGVARSINFYPIEPEKAEDGIVNIALGLGKQIVDGGKSLRFSPKFPANCLQLSSPDLTLRDTQKTFFALSLDPHKFVPSISEDVNIIKLQIDDAHKDNALRHIGSTYDMNGHMIKDSIMYDGKKLITFANILKHNSFPLSEILIDFMKIGKMEMNNHIEVEFAVNFPPKGSQEPIVFSLLQIRPIIETDQDINIDLENIDTNKAILYSESALGNGIYSDIVDIIYVKTQNFKFQNNLKTVELVDKLNKKFIDEGRNYVLVGPGRWGSSDPSLGIPVKWANISAARIIVESGLSNYRIDPSQGTHFFHNLTSFMVGYFTINPFINDGLFDEEYLNNLECVYEDDIIRHVKFDKELKIEINGKTSKGIVYKNN
ncbi:MAG: PEP/pyruvate-binding domain-containing protein, partial [Bacteroidales bacterium]|nr:PEP/pyruvate-binding domain-containing protein [Bacteroidales bacterium]